MIKNTELKQVKEYKHFCKTCGKQVRGNGSGLLPYCCACKVYEFNEETNQYE